MDIEDTWPIEDYGEYKSPQNNLEKIKEYLSNTAVFNKELPDHNISEDYLKQTIRFLNELEDE